MSMNNGPEYNELDDRDYDGIYDDGEDDYRDDDSMDGDHDSAMASIGWGYDEQYSFDDGYDDYCD
jgi:hypothetical protein